MRSQEVDSSAVRALDHGYRGAMTPAAFVAWATEILDHFDADAARRDQATAAGLRFGMPAGRGHAISTVEQLARTTRLDKERAAWFELVDALRVDEWQRP